MKGEHEEFEFLKKRIEVVVLGWVEGLLYAGVGVCCDGERSNGF